MTVAPLARLAAALPMTLYRYGRAAWVWRVLILLALSGSVPLLLVGLGERSLTMLALALPLAAPALFFGAALAVRIDQRDDVLHVTTLLFVARRVPVSRILPSRILPVAQGHDGPFPAPRVWVRVERALPIYIDLLGTIPDRRRLEQTLRLIPA